MSYHDIEEKTKWIVKCDDCADLNITCDSVGAAHLAAREHIDDWTIEDESANDWHNVTVTEVVAIGRNV